MDNREQVTQHDLLTIIEDFISKSAGLTVMKGASGELSVCQKSDSKKIRVRETDLIDVLSRHDAEGREFIQVNLTTGKKLLLTDQLVGFKPLPTGDLDVSRLPKVVTTMDLLSVFEAIEESVATHSRDEDTDTLKKVFQAILQGGEDVGFDLSTERSWLRRLPTVTSKASA